MLKVSKRSIIKELKGLLLLLSTLGELDIYQIYFPRLGFNSILHYSTGTENRNFKGGAMKNKIIFL